MKLSITTMNSGPGIPWMYVGEIQHGAPYCAGAPYRRQSCTRCSGTGETSSANHPMCSDCYGTGEAGITMTRLERRNLTK